MKMTAFWYIVPCSLAEGENISEVFAASIMRALIALMMEEVCISETSVNFQATRRVIPEGCNLHTIRRENLKSHEIKTLWQGLKATWCV
jgi:hypothetical protein